MRCQLRVGPRQRCGWRRRAASQTVLRCSTYLLYKLSRLSDAMTYPGLTCEMYLMACRFQENIESVYQRYPILKPVGYERVLLDPQLRMYGK